MTLRLILLAGAALLSSVALLPALAQPLDDSPRAMLVLARGAVDRGRIDAAREALERAETRLLGGVVAGGEAAAVPPLPDIVAARRALDRRDGPAARASIDRALVSASRQAASPPPPGAPGLPGVASTPLPPIAAPPASVVAAKTAPPPVPLVTRALHAGRWKLRKADYVWMPPDKELRPVAAGPRDAPRWVWVKDQYRLLPASAAEATP